MPSEIVTFTVHSYGPRWKGGAVNPASGSSEELVKKLFCGSRTAIHGKGPRGATDAARSLAAIRCLSARTVRKPQRPSTVPGVWPSLSSPLWTRRMASSDFVIMGSLFLPVYGQQKTRRSGGSRCSHAKLDESTELDEGDPDEFGALYSQLARRLPQLHVICGCCGTDMRYIKAVMAAGI